MGMPGDVTMRLVIGNYCLADGTPCEGTVTFRPSKLLTNVPGAITEAYPDDEDGDSGFVTAAPVTVRLFDGRVNVSLAVTDDADLEPGTWLYQVEEKVTGSTRTWTMELPGSDQPFDLASVSDAATAMLSSDMAGLTVEDVPAE